MDSTAQQEFGLWRITGVLWFFLCVFGALEAISVYFFMTTSPNWALLIIEMGIPFGTMGLVLMGALQLAQAFMMSEEPVLQRLRRASGVFLGIFGAMLVLGGSFILMRYPNGYFFLRIGLLGGAGALAATGFLTLGEVFTRETPKERQDGNAGEKETNEFVYSGFWSRFIAYYIDHTIYGVLSFAIAILYIYAYENIFSTLYLLDVSGIVTIFVFLWFYFAFFESSSWRATPGKRAMGIEVVNLNGERISFARATGRYFGKIISVLTLSIGFIMAGFTKRKQALHDKIADCLVVNDG